MSHFHHHHNIVEQGEEEQPLLDDNSSTQPLRPRKVKCRHKLVRPLALLCACSLSVGSHYATYILGPLKSRLSREMGTSNTEFGLLLAALSLSGTWTPLVGGVMTARLGTTISSIIATGTVFLGQILLLCGHLNNQVRLMTLGMFIFGLGQSPLAVAQETIIVRFFKSHGLGISLALGLIAGKGASFVSARTSYPLSQWSPDAPFYFSAGAAGFSFLINLFYISISKWLIREAGAELEDAELCVEAKRRSIVSMSEAQVIQRVADKRRFRLNKVFKLGDVVWAYIALNVLCGFIWHPFVHLAPNIFERRFGLSELDASTSAAYLLSGSVFLYPVCGMIVDKVKRGSIVVQLMAFSSVLTLCSYLWMILPPTITLTPWPAIVCFGTAMGFAPLLLVVIVPRIVRLEYISTTLGLHKSLEHTGTTIAQTLAGLWLDSKAHKEKFGLRSLDDNDSQLQWLLNGFLIVNIVHLIAIWGLGYLHERKQHTQKQKGVIILNESHEDETPNANLEGASASSSSNRTSSPPPSRDTSLYQNYGTQPLQNKPTEEDVTLKGCMNEEEAKRGMVFAMMSGGVVLFAWLLFLVTSIVKIRSRQDREGQT